MNLARATGWILLSVVALPVLLTLCLTTEKAIRVLRAGYPIGNETLEFLIFGGAEILMFALALTLPVVVCLVIAITARPRFDTWLFNIVVAAAGVGWVLLVFPNILEIEQSELAAWIFATAFALLPRAAFKTLRPGNAAHRRAAA